jgi:hypothetical protein
MPEFKEKKPDRYILMDTSTGLIVASFSHLPSNKDAKGKGYFMLWHAIALDDRVRKADALLYLKLCTIMEPGGWIAETQRSVATKFGLDYSNVVKGMGRLIELGYILKAEHKGSIWFQINPEHAHRGPLLYRKT